VKSKPRQPRLYRGHPSANGLVAVWPLVEGGSVARDCSGYRNHGPITDGAWSFDRPGRVLECNGTTTYVDAGDPAELQITGSLTLAVLYRQTIAVSNKYLAGKKCYSVFSNTDQAVFETRNAANDGWDSNAMSPVYTRGDWILAVARYSAEAQQKQVWANAIPGTAVAKTDGSCGGVSGTPFRLGRYSSGTSYFPGQIALAALWDRALAENEIRRLSADPFFLLRPVGQVPILYRTFALGSADALRLIVDSAELVHLAAVRTIPGVVLRAVAGRNGPGTGRIRSNGAAGTLLSWRAPGSSTFGPMVDAAAGGECLLSDGEDDDCWVRVEVYPDHLGTGPIGSPVHLGDLYNNHLGQADLSAAEATAGDVLEYEVTLENAGQVLWLSQIRVWLDAAVSDLEISDDGIAWVSPTSEAAALWMADLAPLASQTLYLKRTIGAAAGYDPDVLNHLRLSFFGL